MKFSWAALILCLAVSSFAPAESPDDPSRTLGNLVFFPSAGLTTITTAYQSSLNEVGPTVDSSLNETRTKSTTYQQIPISIWYGMTNNLRVGLTDTDLLGQTDTTTFINSGVTATDSSAGISALQYSLAWRYFSNPEMTFFADWVIDYTAPNGTHLAATAGQGGNTLPLGAVTTLNFPLLWYFGEEEFSLIPEGVYHSAGFAQGPSSASTLTYPDPHWTGSVTLNFRSHYGRHIFLQPAVVASLPFSDRSVSQLGINTTTRRDGAVSPQMAFGYTPKKWLVLNATIAFSSVPETVATSGSSPTQTTTYDSTITFSTRFAF